MANTIKQKRGSGSNPSASDLEVGELAIRTDNGHLFTKNDSGTVIEHADIGVLTANTLLGRRVSNGTPQELTASQVRTIINVADGATNVTNNNQLTNGAGYITSSNSAVTGKLSKAGGTITGNLQVNGTTTLNGNIDLGDASAETVTFTAVVDSDIYPEIDSSHDLGNAFQKWDNVYANTFTGNAATATKLATARTIAGTSFDGSANINISFNSLTNKPTIPTNNNQLTNGAGYLTSSSNLNADKLSSGTIPAARIGSNAVTFARMQNIAEERLIGRVSSGTGDPEALTQAQVRTFLGLASSATTDTTNASNISSGTIPAARIGNDAVTYAKIQNVSATNRILGRDSAGAGNIEEITPANLRTMLNVADGANNITNNNQLTNGAGYITSQRSVESVQDIVGGMVSGNSESGITVTYQDSDGTIDFSVSSQTDNNFTNALKTKLDGIASSATNVTNNNQLTNGAGYITSQRSVESVQDIVGGMVSGNSESGITVTYQDSDGTLDFSVASQTDQNFTTALKNKLDGIASSATNVTNNNQLTNGAGYITSQRSVESVQDIVGAMVTGNTESGISVTYQDADGTLDFSVSSQTDNNFTTALKNKLDGIESGAKADQTGTEIRALLAATSNTNILNDTLLSKLNGIASGATNVTNNNQISNGAGYITSSNSAITNKMPKSGGTFSGTVNLGGNDIDNVGRMTGNGLTLEDDGESSPTFKLVTDDEAPYAMQISNSTYSTQQVGLLTFVKNNGDAELLHAGNGEFKDFSIGTSLGIGFITCIKIDGSEQQVELYKSGSKVFETVGSGVEVTGSCQAGSFKSDDLLPPVFQFTNGNKAGQLSVGNANIDGTGTVTLESDFNVSSVSDSGSGVYDISFDENYKNSHYIVTAESGLISSTSSASTTVDIRNMSSSGFRLLIEDVDAGFIDVDYVMFSIFEN
tara:strand:- start:734 stop:3529 length:2796 start_codon:yes stop_codon:yes gene_type:complete